MAVSVDEIRGSINMAREMAVTGNYDSSLVYYEGAKLQMGRFLSTIDNQTRRESWRTVSYILLFCSDMLQFLYNIKLCYIRFNDRLMKNVSN